MNGGVLINPTNGDTRFELTKIDPVLYSQIRYLEADEISNPLIDEDQSGNKKYKILKINKRFEEHTADFIKDYAKIKELALKDKKLKAIQKWVRTRIDETYISINSDSRGCDFSQNWITEAR